MHYKQCINIHRHISVNYIVYIPVIPLPAAKQFVVASRSQVNRSVMEEIWKGYKCGTTAQ